MNAGGAAPHRVRDRIATGLANSGVEVTHEILDAVINSLEAAGYRVVRAGQVPNGEALTQVQNTLEAAHDAADGDTVLCTAMRAQQAATTVKRLRDVAACVLGVDLDDVDERAPTKDEMLQAIMERS